MKMDNYKISFRHERFGRMSTKVDPNKKDGTRMKYFLFIPIVVKERKAGDRLATHCTTCFIQDMSKKEGSRETARGLAFCSVSNNFCKNIGRRIALTRALKELPEELNNKEFRTKIWNAYLDRFPKETEITEEHMEIAEELAA